MHWQPAAWKAARVLVERQASWLGWLYLRKYQARTNMVAQAFMIPDLLLTEGKQESQMIEKRWNHVQWSHTAHSPWDANHHVAFFLFHSWACGFPVHWYDGLMDWYAKSMYTVSLCSGDVYSSMDSLWVMQSLSSLLLPSLYFTSGLWWPHIRRWNRVKLLTFVRTLVGPWATWCVPCLLCFPFCKEKRSTFFLFPKSFSFPNGLQQQSSKQHPWTERKRVKKEYPFVQAGHKL